MEKQDAENLLLRTLCEWNTNSWIEEVSGTCSRQVQKNTNAHELRLRTLRTAIQAGNYSTPRFGEAEGFLREALNYTRERHG